MDRHEGHHVWDARRRPDAQRLIRAVTVLQPERGTAAPSGVGASHVVACPSGTNVVTVSALNGGDAFELRLPDGERAHRAEISARNEVVVVTERGLGVLVYACKRGAKPIVLTNKGAKPRGYDIVFGKEGRLVLVHGLNEIALWDLESDPNTPVGVLAQDHISGNVKFVADDTQVIFHTLQNRALHVWDPVTGEVSVPHPLPQLKGDDHYLVRHLTSRHQGGELSLTVERYGGPRARTMETVFQRYRFTAAGVDLISSQPIPLCGSVSAASDDRHMLQSQWSRESWRVSLLDSDLPCPLSQPLLQRTIPPGANVLDGANGHLVVMRKTGARKLEVVDLAVE